MTRQVEKFLQELMGGAGGKPQHVSSRRNGCETATRKGQHHSKLIEIEDLVQGVSFNFQHQ